MSIEREEQKEKRDGRRNRALIAGSLMALLLGVTAAVVPSWLARDPVLPVTPVVGEPLPPQRAFPCGTDELGRDVCARIVYAARVSLGIALAATAMSLGIGVTTGLTAGYLGGWADTVLMRVTEVLLAVPVLLLAITLAALFDPSPVFLFAVIGVVGWTSVARAVRAEVRSLRSREFVLAAEALGATDVRILWHTILPNLWPTIWGLGAVTASQSLLIDAGLSFIGLGVPPPTPSWGRMLSESQAYYRVAPWLVLFPGAALSLAVLSFQLIASGLARQRSVLR